MQIHALTADFLSTLNSEGYNPGVGELLRVQELIKKLPTDLTANELKFVLIPVLAKSPEEQTRFSEIFDECFARFNSLHKNSEATAPSSQNISSVVKAKPVSKLWLWFIPIFLVLFLGLGWQYYADLSKASNDKPINPSQEDKTPTYQTINNFDSLKTTYLPPKSVPFNHESLLQNIALKEPSNWQKFRIEYWDTLRWILAIALTGLMFWVWMSLMHKRRKLILEYTPKDQAPFFWNIRIDQIGNVLQEDGLNYVAQIMRRRQAIDAKKINVNESVKATINKGGALDLKYDYQTQSVEYLILIDRQYSRNHRTYLFDSLYQAFKTQEVLIERYFFDSDPRFCYNESYPNGRALHDLQQHYNDAYLIIVSTGLSLLSPRTGQLNAWTDIFSQWKNRVLFSPKPINNWNRDERRLGTLFTLLPATLQAFNFWVSELSNGQDAQFKEWREQIQDAPRTSIQVEEANLLPNLMLYYEPKLLTWVAACAIYPTLHWDLTLWLGHKIEHLSGNSSEDTMVTYSNLLSMLRLPWFIEGEISDSSRKILLEWIELEQPTLVQFLRQELARLLESNPPPQDSSSWDTHRMNIAINQWLSVEDPKIKKNLEQEIATLLQNGVEIDFAVVNYLKRPKSSLDLIVPNSWKKHLAPKGYLALGWHPHLKDLVWIIPGWILLAIALFWPYPKNNNTCQSDILTYVINSQQLKICLDSTKHLILLNEFLVRDFIEEDNFKALDVLLAEKEISGNSTLVNNRLIRKTIESKVPKNSKEYPLLLEANANIAVALYEKGRSLWPRDSACYWLEKAIRYDSSDLDIIRAVGYCRGKAEKQFAVQILGSVQDSVSREPLQGVKITGKGINLQSDINGQYVMQLPKDYFNSTIKIAFEKKEYKTQHLVLSNKELKAYPIINLSRKFTTEPIAVKKTLQFGDTSKTERVVPFQPVDKPFKPLEKAITEVITYVESSLGGWGTTLFVKKGSQGNGTSWSQAFGDLQYALQVAKPGTQIWVASGVYLPSQTGNRNASFVIKEGITLLGGFVGNEVSQQLRNWKINPTILSGNIGGVNSADDNSFNVVYTRNVSNVTVDGFVICNGNASNSNEIEQEGSRTSTGAGWYNEASQGLHEVKITNCIFQDNKSNYAAGIYNSAISGAVNSSEIISCQFIRNNAQVEGGAIMNVGNGGDCSVIIERCNLKDNFALYGGAIFTRAINNGINQSRFAYNTFHNNNAYIDGADFFNNRDNTSINKSLFKNNESSNAPSPSNILDEVKMTPNTVSRMRANSRVKVKENEND